MIKEVFAYFFVSSIIFLLVLRSSKVHNRRAQGAMEFMMTYGWAILVVLISLTALYYFGGIGDSSKSISSVCILPPGFSCNDFQITTTGIILVIQNGLGYDINQLGIDIKNGPVPFTQLSGQSLKYGESKEFLVPVIAGNPLNLGQKFKGDIVLTYVKSAGTLTSTTTGSIGGTTETTGTPPTPVTCTDTDSGSYPTINYDMQGTVSISSVPSGTDSCSGADLTEYSCQASNSASASSSVYPCPNGCSAGKCNPAMSTGNIKVTITKSYPGTPFGALVRLNGVDQGYADPFTGEYTIPSLAPGPYDVDAFYTGYTTLSATPLNPITVISGLTSPVNIILKSTDITKPTITNLQATSITANSAQIRWNTDEPTTSSVNYSINPPPNYADGKLTIGNTGTSLIVTLTGLSPSTLYYYKVNATDMAGNTQYGSGTFTTLLTNPVCYGTPSECFTFFSLPSCNNAGCSWTCLDPPDCFSNDCSGTPNVCSYYTSYSQSRCISAGCAWG
ncbi:MAG: fibronectin type III domain-containing protein [Nanoarchaeota archaeon]